MHLAKLKHPLHVLFFTLLILFSAGLTVVRTTTVAAVQCADGSILPDAEAANCPTGNPSDGSCESSFLGLPTWYKYLQLDGDCKIVGPQAEDSTPQNIRIDWPRALGYVALAIVEILLRVAALVAVGFVIYGGFRFITSQGDPENAKSARNTIINGVIGLVISMIATGTVMFIGSTIS